MHENMDVGTLLAPISECDPAGEDLRYSTFYERIKEARRNEDAVALGDWQREVKSSDWDKTIALSVEALTKKTKDLQIAAWLTEALTVTEGFEGLEMGLRLLAGLLDKFWDGVHPHIDDGDIEYRTAPFDFLNNKVTIHVKHVPLTDRRFTPGYSWLNWQESREVGLEADTRNRKGEIDDSKKQRRDERIAEGGLTAEAFDAAVAQSEPCFEQALYGRLVRCQEAFKTLDQLAEKKFERNAPRLSDLGAVIDECLRLVQRIYPGLKECAASAQTPSDSMPMKAPLELELSGPVRGDSARSAQVSALSEESSLQNKHSWPPCAPSQVPDFAAQAESELAHLPENPAQAVDEGTPSHRLPPPYKCRLRTAQEQADLAEEPFWEEALRVLDSNSFEDALGMLLSACKSSSSVRNCNRFRLLMVKLCLKTGRSDLARPIIEDLHGMIDELHLERWESPFWIAEVLEAYYLCLQGGGLPDDDLVKSRDLFRRICGLDVTRAVAYRM